MKELGVRKNNHKHGKFATIFEELVDVRDVIAL